MRTKILFLLLLSPITAFLQDYRFGRVSADELKKTESTIDPEAAAEVIYEKVYISLDYDRIQRAFYITKEFEGRIKIYNKDKVTEEYLNHNIRLYSASTATREKVLNIRATTNNLENGKVASTRVRNSEIYNEKLNKYWEMEKFAFPNVQNGSVLEYKYTVTSPFIRDIGRWYFQKDIPVVYSQYIFKHPDFFFYSQDNRGEISGRITNDSQAVPGEQFRNNVVEYTFTNVPALKEEPFVFNLNNLKASTRFELMQFSHPTVLGEDYTTSWEQIGKDLMNHSNFGAELRGNNFLDETVQELTKNRESPLEKMYYIFQHIRDNYTWDGVHSLYTEKGVRQAFRNKTGNVVEINLMLVSMLQKAGLNAHPVVLSTVNNLMLNYSFPSRTSLNFVIAMVELNNQIYLMDATEKYSNINMLPIRDLNHRGFKIMSNGVEEVSLTNYGISSIKENLMVNLESDGSVSGNYAQSKDAYFAMNDRIKRARDSKAFEEDLKRKYSFDLDNFTINENPERGLMRYAFRFKDVQGAESIGNKLIVNPLFFTQVTRSVFRGETRNYPLEFGTIVSNERTIKIKIPEGYKVESLPSFLEYRADGNVANYVYSVTEKDGFIEVKTLYEIGYSILPGTYFASMKKFEEKQIQAESQQIVLVKK